MSFKERVVFLDRAALTPDDLPIPGFEHNWSEFPFTEAADLVPRLFWATTAITHATPIDAEAIGQLHKLIRVVVTGPAAVDGGRMRGQRDRGASFARERCAGAGADRAARGHGC